MGNVTANLVGMVSLDAESIDLHPLLKKRGITDLDSGLERTDEYFKRFLTQCKDAMSSQQAISSLSMGLLAMLTRARSFHDGARAMILDDNPFAADALIRSYAENAAALLWIESRPHDAAKFSFAYRDGRPVPVGRMVDAAVKRAPGFKLLYSRLSESAHPNAVTFSSTWKTKGKDREVQWASAPSYKVEENRLWACLWLMELTDVHIATWPHLYRNAVNGSGETKPQT